jgi:hypothetical protein
LNLSDKIDSRFIPLPGGRFPVISSILKAALAVLKDRGELAALTMMRNGMTVMRDQNAISV